MWQGWGRARGDGRGSILCYNYNYHTLDAITGSQRSAFLPTDSSLQAQEIARETEAEGVGKQLDHKLSIQSALMFPFTVYSCSPRASSPKQRACRWWDPTLHTPTLGRGNIERKQNFSEVVIKGANTPTSPRLWSGPSKQPKNRGLHVPPARENKAMPLR